MHGLSARKPVLSPALCLVLDILSVNQHSDTLAQKHDVAAFSDVVQACSGGTLVVMVRGSGRGGGGGGGGSGEGLGLLRWLKGQPAEWLVLVPCMQCCV